MKGLIQFLCAMLFGHDFFNGGAACRDCGFARPGLVSILSRPRLMDRLLCWLSGPFCHFVRRIGEWRNGDFWTRLRCDCGHLDLEVQDIVASRQAGQWLAERRGRF